MSLINVVTSRPDWRAREEFRDRDNTYSLPFYRNEEVVICELSSKVAVSRFVYVIVESLRNDILAVRDSLEQSPPSTFPGDTSLKSERALEAYKCQ